ncbi:MAG TPA: hypothetical protein PKA64_13295, partial [Myxococcota bacterium]|nr:hypothetical protein [Myxococcota bacterium]
PWTLTLDLPDGAVRVVVRLAGERVYVDALSLRFGSPYEPTCDIPIPIHPPIDDQGSCGCATGGGGWWWLGLGISRRRSRGAR